jgi:DNA repair photolyase
MAIGYEKIDQADQHIFDKSIDGKRMSEHLEHQNLRVFGNARRGRGAALNISGRHETLQYEPITDHWSDRTELPGFDVPEVLNMEPPLRTKVHIETAKTIITTNQSPDLPFSKSINAYRGCEHGCIYCYARPSHANMGLSPGLDFESELFAKPNAAELLEKALADPKYQVKPIALGTNTDPYQPIEKKYEITRQVLEVLEQANHPVMILTKSSLITRDIDILSRMAKRQLVKVGLSITSLDHRLSRNLEPRASTPSLRLKALRELSAADIPCFTMVAPIIPALNDHEIERILEAAHANGSEMANFILLRLPQEVAPLFKDWLLRNYPDRYRHVLSLLRSMRGGKDYDTKWGKRMRGEGPYAWQLKRRFDLACKKLGLRSRGLPLNCDEFTPPVLKGTQLSLF